MTDKRIKMECPFCHTSVKDIQIKMIGKTFGTISCPKCGCHFSGKSKIELIDKWNTR